MFELFKDLLDFNGNGELDLEEEVVGLTIFAKAMEADKVDADDDSGWSDTETDDE